MQQSQKKKVNGYILAGGKSTRMGTDKGLLLFNGNPLILKIIDQLQPVVNKVVIVSNNPDYKQFGYPVISDIIKDKGPAGGIYTALKRTNSLYNFIISCDMPFVSSRSINFIIRNSFQAQITLPFLHEKTEPLFGVYTKDCLSGWQKLIEQGNIKLQDMITHFDLLILNVDGNELFNDLHFVNINDKKELTKQLKNINKDN